jgi:hypothetical protein
MQNLNTDTKQIFFSPGPSFSVFKHRKLCLNTKTKHALRILSIGSDFVVGVLLFGVWKEIIKYKFGFDLSNGFQSV